MMFDVLDKLNDEFSNHAFGRNKAGELFVNGEKVGISWSDISDKPLDEKLSKDVKDVAVQELYLMLKNMLLERKIISYPIEEE